MAGWPRSAAERIDRPSDKLFFGLFHVGLTRTPGLVLFWTGDGCCTSMAMVLRRFLVRHFGMSTSTQCSGVYIGETWLRRCRLPSPIVFIFSSIIAMLWRAEHMVGANGLAARAHCQRGGGVARRRGRCYLSGDAMERRVATACQQVRNTYRHSALLKPWLSQPCSLTAAAANVRWRIHISLVWGLDMPWRNAEPVTMRLVCVRSEKKKKKKKKKRKKKKKKEKEEKELHVFVALTLNNVSCRCFSWHVIWCRYVRRRWHRRPLSCGAGSVIVTC